MSREAVVGALIVGVLGLTGAQSVLAAKGDLRVSGFARAAGAAVLDGAPDYMGRIDRDGDAGETQFGINLNADIGDGYQVAGQLWGAGVEGEPAEGTGPLVERYRMGLDWAYITKQVSGNLSLSAGKIKYPNLLVSEYVDVGLAYPWVRPPEELYRFETEGPYISLESFEGATAIYSMNLGDMDLNLQAYGGQANVEDGHLEQMFGTKVVLTGDMFTVIAAHNRHVMDTVGDERGVFNGEVASVTNFGVILDVANAVVYAEYAMGKVDEDEVTAYYATLGYRVGDILPYVTYANVENNEDWGQSSVSAGVKYQLNSSASLKVEFKNITPVEEGGVPEPGEGAGFFSAELEEGTESANLISVAVDVVF